MVSASPRVVEQEACPTRSHGDGQYQNRIRALSRSGEKLVRRRTRGGRPRAGTAAPADEVRGTATAVPLL